MLIREITLRNLLSFGPETPPLELRPLNVLIGPNGSGKSNLIEAISLLQAAPKDISTPIGEGGGIDEWLWKGTPSEAASICAELSLDGSEKTFNHCFSLRKSGPSFTIQSESLRESDLEGRVGTALYLQSSSTEVTVRSGSPRLGPPRVVHFDQTQSVLSQLAVLAQVTEAQGGDHGVSAELIATENLYKSIRIYRDWSFGRKSPVRGFKRADLKGDFLSENFENLGLVLNRLKPYPKVKRRFLELLSDLYPGITDHDIAVFGGMFQLYLEEGDRTIPASRLSDGTLRYLCLLAILCHPEPPPLICIEEPELGLHPDVLVNLAKLIKEASERTQLIITTHSEILVDALTYCPEDVVVFEKGEGGTVMKRLDAEDLSVWLEDYTLGQLWSRGQIGGNRW